MGEPQARGKRVVLCGDLDLIYRSLDQKPGRLLLWVDSAGFLDVPALAAKVDLDASLNEVAHQDGCGKCGVLRLGPFGDLAGQWVAVNDLCERTKVPKIQLQFAGECIHICPHRLHHH